jgi:hypothetical protein
MENIDRSFHAQGSPEWYAERLAKFTSSKVAALLVTNKKAGQVFGDGAWTYIYEKISEMATGMIAETFGGNDATDWGNAHEPDGDFMYKKIKQIETIECGFITLNEAYGGSPDRLVGLDGLTEIKCPYNSANHIRHLDLESADDFRTEYPKYYTQVQGNLYATDRVWCDFISFDPRPKIEALQIKILRIYRDETMIRNIEECVGLATELVYDRFERMILSNLAEYNLIQPGTNLLDAANKPLLLN